MRKLVLFGILVLGLVVSGCIGGTGPASQGQSEGGQVNVQTGVSSAGSSPLTEAGKVADSQLRPVLEKILGTSMSLQTVLSSSTGPFGLPAETLSYRLSNVASMNDFTNLSESLKNQGYKILTSSIGEGSFTCIAYKGDYVYTIGWSSDDPSSVIVISAKVTSELKSQLESIPQI